MKRFWFCLKLALLGTILIYLFAKNAQAQGVSFVGYNAFKSITVSAPTVDTGVYEINSGISYHKLTWTTTGTVSTCSVRVDSSADNISFTAGGAVTAQTCTSNGASTITNFTFNYIRINVTALTGGGSINVVYTGYVNNPNGTGGTGTVTSVTFTGDGVLLSSTPSSAVTTSGTLTATQANFGAFSLLANNTNVSAAPTAVAFGTIYGAACTGAGKALTWDGTSIFGCNTISSGTGTVTNVATGTGLTGGPITTTGTISLANTAVTPGSYVASDITVDQQGRLTSAASGVASDIVGLFSSCSGTQYLGADGVCHTPAVGTVTQSGGTLGFIPEWGTVPNLINSPLDDGATVTGFVSTSKPVNLGTNVLAITPLLNDTVTGTTLGRLAKISGGKFIISTTSDLLNVVGCVVAGAGTSGSPTIAAIGQTAACFFDNNPTTQGDYVGPSNGTAATLKDLGASPGAAEVMGTVLSTHAACGSPPCGPYGVLFNTIDAITQQAGAIAKPGGATTNIQYNNAGAFGGDSLVNLDSTNHHVCIGAAAPCSVGGVTVTDATNGTILATNSGSTTFASRYCLFACSGNGWRFISDINGAKVQNLTIYDNGNNQADMLFTGTGIGFGNGSLTSETGDFAHFTYSTGTLRFDTIGTNSAIDAEIGSTNADTTGLFVRCTGTGSGCDNAIRSPGGEWEVAWVKNGGVMCIHDALGSAQDVICADPTTNNVAIGKLGASLTSLPTGISFGDAGQTVLSHTGVPTKLAGTTLAGDGLSGIVYSQTTPGAVAAISDTTMVTPAASALYLFTGEINCTATSAAAQASLNLKWTDTGSQAQTATVTDTCTALGSGSVASLVQAIRAKNGTAVTWGVTITNTPTYDVDIRLELK